MAATGTLAGSVAGTNNGAIEGIVNLTPVVAGSEGQEAFAGGIVATNDGTIADCANLGAVTNTSTAGNSAAAGIAARGTGTIATSYNAGNVHAAQNGAYLATTLTANGDYATIVDDASCYLAPGEATYEGISAAGKDRPGALTSAELADAATRLNATREGDAAAWSAGGDATNGFPVPSEPANPDALVTNNALASSTSRAATPRAATYANWFEVGRYVFDQVTLGGTIDNPDWYPSGKGTQADPYVIKTPEALAVFAYGPNGDAGRLPTGSAKFEEAYVVIDQSVSELDLFGSAYTGKTATYDANGNLTNLSDALPWVPIGRFAADISMEGWMMISKFNGNGCTITSLNADWQAAGYSTIGFFGGLGPDGVVENVHIGKNSRLSGVETVGAVVGSVYSQAAFGTVRNCSNAATVEGTKNVGGIVGQTAGNNGINNVIESCSNSGSVTATTQNAGGIVGGGTFVSVTDCSNGGTVSGRNNNGGIGGYTGKSQYLRCINEGSVTASGICGGVVGRSATSLKQCGNRGSVEVAVDGTDESRAGGLMGIGAALVDSPLVVEDCYNTGAVSVKAAAAEARGAGLVAMTSLSTTAITDTICTVSNSYSAGAVTGSRAYALVGPQRAADDPTQGLSMTNSFYASDAAGADTSVYLDKDVPYVTAKSTSAMKEVGFAGLLNGRKYVGDEAGTTSTTWTTDAQKNGADTLKNSGFPVFGNLVIKTLTNWEEVGKAVDVDGLGTIPTEQSVTWGDGTAGDAYVISTPEQLAWFAYKVNTDNANFQNKNVQLAADIDLSGFAYNDNTEVLFDYANCLPWITIGKDVLYSGHFDGAGFQVKNVRIDAGLATTYSTVGFFGIVGGKVERLVISSGCLEASNSGSNAISLGTFVSMMMAPLGGSIRNCASLMDIRGRGLPGLPASSTISGFAGAVQTSELITNCYYAGEVWTDVSDAFAVSSSGTLTGVYYDKDENPSASSSQSGAVGKTTAELKSADTVALLNGSAATAVWDTDTKGRNNGYPVILHNGELPVPTSWAEIGKRMQERAAGMPDLPTEQPVTWGDGTAGTAYVISTPEQLAWFAYMVDIENATFKPKNVQLAADIDLAGFAYTGQIEVGASYANCLKWSSIGYVDMHVGRGVAYGGHFDGAGHVVKNLRLVSQTGRGSGFFGWVQGSTIERLGLASGCISGSDSESSSFAGYTFVGTLKNCYSRVDAAADASGGGLLRWSEVDTKVENCYYAGAVASGSSLRPSAEARGDFSGWKNVYYDSEKNPAITDETVAIPKTSAQFKTWGAAYQLGGGDGAKAFADVSTKWRVDTANANDGYPVPCKSGESLAVATSWANVAQWVDDFATDKKPAVDAGAAAGSTAAPFQIGSPEAFAWFASKVNSGSLDAASQNATLTADIDLTGNAYTGKSGTGTDFTDCLRWDPIGTAGHHYVGAFEGAGFGVQNMRVDKGTAADGALFAMLGVNASIANTGVDSGHASGGGRIAGLIAYLHGANVKVTGCWNSASVSGSFNAGGVIGATHDAPGTVISKCWNTGSITQQANSDSAGGIVGKLHTGDNIITDCYNTGTISAARNGGGIVGNLEAGTNYTITNCYNAGKVTGTSSGSLVGTSDLNPTNSYYATDLGSAENVVKGTGLTTTQMKTRGLALNLNGNKSGSGTAWTWTSGYPTLGEMAEVTWMDIGQAIAKDEGTFATFKPATGDGTTEATATQIATPEGLAWYSYQASQDVAPAFARLTSDIDLAGLSYVGKEDAGTGAGHANCLEWAFLSIITGTFDGGGHTLKNMRGGAFCGAVSDGTVKGVNVADSTFEAAAIAVMTIGSASVVRCSAAADVKVSDSSDVAGLVVQMDGGTLEDCWSRAAVDSTSGAAGGLVGSIESGCTVKNCYSAPVSLTGATSSGALFGKQRTASSTISVTNCYYPQSMNAAGTGTVTGATPMTEARMRTPLLAFNLNATRTGDAAPWTWNLLANDGYPSFGVPPADVDASTWAGIARLLDEGQLRRTEAAIDANGFGTMGTVHDAAPAAGETWLPALSGTGAADDVFVIRTPEAFAWFAYQVNQATLAAANQNAKLGASIDLAGFAYTGATEVGTNFANCLEWIPIGNGLVTTLTYQGTFSGQGKTVTNLRSTSTVSGAVRGLFGSVKGGGVSNLVLSGGYVSNAGPAGGLVGMHLSNATVEDCTVDVDVVGGNDCAGGVICAVYPDAGQVRRCANLGDVSSTGSTSTAGIVGGASVTGSLVIEDCYNTGAVNAAGRTAAGIYGRGTVSSGAGTVSIKNCYNAGAITGATLANSIAKVRSGVTLTNCYYDKAKCTDASVEAGTTPVTSGELQSWGAAYALGGGDGVKALGDLKTWRAAADANDNGGFPVLVRPGATGDAAHMTPAADWSDVGAWVDVFAPAKKPTGDGAATGSGSTGPFQIGTSEAFAWLAYQVNNGLAAANHNASLTANIDLAGNAFTGKSGAGTDFADCLRWIPLGSNAHQYRGAFEGAGFGAQNMRVDQGSAGDGGLFGTLGANATIANMGVDSGRSSGNGGHIAGFIGYAHGANIKVTGCWNGASVVGKTNTGGVIGVTHEATGTVISKCWNTGSVTQTSGDSAGGVVGRVHSGNNTITDCYNTGAISAVTYGGGIVGNLENTNYTIANCYNAGKVTGSNSGSLVGASGLNPTNSYYATDVGSATNVVKGTGVTSAQLKTWGAAYQLNGGDGVKALADLKTWRKAADGNDNGGFPVLVAAGATGDAAHMTPATSWDEVAVWVDVFGAGQKPTVTSLTWRDGTSAATGYELGTPAQLAWFAYKMDHGLAAESQNVALTANIDLSGRAFTGATELGADFANCLEWKPISKPGSYFVGRFDGRGHAVENLRMTVTYGNQRAGFFGEIYEPSVVIERLGIASGALDMQSSSTYVATFVAIGYCSFLDCYSLADVVGPNASWEEVGGFTGSSASNVRFVNCYYGGNYDKFWGKWEDDHADMVKNCFKLGSTQTQASSTVRGLTADQLASWGAAYALNGGDGAKALGDLKTWRVAADANENGGYPVLIKEGDIVASMTAAHDWADVGLWVDAFATDKRPADDGLAATPFQIGTPEALAWFAYKVNLGEANGGLATTNQNAKLTADIDLLGAVFTGKTGTAAADSLVWSPIGKKDDGKNFAGTINGANRVIDHLYVDTTQGLFRGLVGFANTVTIERLGIGENSLVVSTSTTASAAFVAACQAATNACQITDCWNRAEVTGTSGYVGAFLGDDYGGYTGSTAAIIKNCYNAGKSRFHGASSATFTNCYADTQQYANAAAGSAAGAGTCVGTITVRTTTQMRLPVAAFNLNAGRTGDAAPWTWNLLINNGYPSFGVPPADVDASTWAGIGKLQTEATLRLTAAVIDANGFGTMGTVQTTAPATPALSGTGAAADPYVIRTPEAFAWFAYQVNSSALAAANQNAQLGANIDLAGLAYTGATEVGTNFANCLKWVPIGGGNGTNTIPTAVLAYEGAFDGQGHKVTSLTVVPRKFYSGLFGVVKDTTIRDVHVASGYVAGVDRVGAMVGNTVGTTVVEDCSNAAEIYADPSVAGGTACNTAGVVGCGYYGVSLTIKRCFNTGKVRAVRSAAGVVDGHAQVVEDCYNTGEVSRTGTTGGYYVSGITNMTKAVRCYNTGNVSGSGNYAVAPTATDSFYLAGITGAGNGQGTQLTAAQLASWGAAYQLNVPMNADGTQKALADLKTWRMAADASENGGYPVLVKSGATGDAAHMQPTSAWSDVGAWVDVFAADQKPTGDGTAATPFEISTPRALAWFALKVNDATLAVANHNVKLTANIDLLGAAYSGKSGTATADSLAWTPIGKRETGKKFTGSIDGGGHMIDHLYVNLPSNDYVGLVGWADRVSIDRLGIGANSSVTGKANAAAFVGACLAAQNACMITNCWNRAQVAVVGVHAGAFLGDDSGSYSGATAAFIENCYNAGDATFGDVSNGTIRNCYADTERYADAALGYNNVASALGVTTAQLQSWGAAYALGGGDGTQEKNPTTLTTWRKAVDANDNGGYPVLVATGATGDAAHLQPASEWADVGAWVDNFAPAKKPTGDGAATGSGATGPFQISTPEAFAWFASKVNDDTLAVANQNAALTTNVDLSGWAYTGNDPAAGAGEGHANCLKWTPVGIQAEGGIANRTFRGGFDGQGHTVESLRLVSDGKPCGLFGHTSGSASIKRLGISSGTLDSTAQYISHTSAATFVGWHEAGTVRDCYSVANVDDPSNNAFSSGGFVGYLDYGTFENCYYAGNRGRFWGIPEAGRPNVQLKNCMLVGSQRDNYDNKDVPAANLRGLTADQLKSWGAAYVLNGGDGTQAKNPTTLTTWRKAVDASDNGGFPVLVTAGATGDAAHLQPAANWGDVGAWVDTFAPDKKPTVGDGSSTAPWQLDTPEHLAWFGHLVNGSTDSVPTRDKCAVLGNNLEMTGFVYTGQTEVGTNYANCLPWAEICPYSDSIEYNGTFDGAGHTLSNLVGQGLFCRSNGATFKDVGIAASAINTTTGYVGALVGVAANGSITRCWVAADVSVTATSTESWAMAGGLVGEINRRATMSDCYSLATVGGAEYTGGLLGRITDSTVNNCYSAPASLSGTSKVGLFVGYVSGGTATNCFYQETTGKVAVGEGTLDGLASKTAVELATERMAYDLNAGRKGESAPWTQAADVNAGYPRLGDPPIDTIIKNWGDVGAAQVEATLRLTEAVIDANGFGTTGTVHDAPPVDGSYTPALSGQGTELDPYVVSTPEALAWFAYKVNNDNTNFVIKDVALGASIDLFGSAYTNATFDSGADLNTQLQNALPWVPLGNSLKNSSSTAFNGVFDGRTRVVRHMYTDPAIYRSGLIGHLRGEVRGVTVEASYLRGEQAASVVAVGDTGSLDRCAASSDVTVEGSAGAGGLVYVIEGIDSSRVSTITNSFSKASVSGPGSSGLVWGAAYTSIENCYFAGAATHGIASLVPEATGKNNFYLDSAATDTTNDAAIGAKAVTAEQLQSWGAAYQLNSGDGVKALGDLKTWRKAADANDNGGFPVLVATGATGDAAHMQPAADWSEVAAWVDVFATTKKPAEVDAPASWGAAAGTKAYSIDTPEKLAWFAYKVNTDNAAFGAKNAVLAADIDLFGTTYTGRAFDAAAADLDAHLKADALAWTPIGEKSSLFDESRLFKGSFDGQGYTVSHLLTLASKFSGGLIGLSRQAAVSRIAVESSSVSSTAYSGAVVAYAQGGLIRECSVGSDVRVFGGTPGGVVSFMTDGTISDCYSRAVVSDGLATGQQVYTFPAGIVCEAGSTTIKNCYFAGTACRAVVGSIGESTSANNYYLGGSTTHTEVSGVAATQLTQTQLRSWKSAYNLNGNSYVGKPTSGGAVASTVWTYNPQKADGTWTYGNDGYPVFGNLELEKLSVTVDPNDVLLPAAAGATDPAKKVAGTITTPLLVAHPLAGPVELLEAPSAPAGVTLSDASTVDAGFSTWGTVSANAKVALVAGTTSLMAGTAAGTALSTGDLASIDVHAAAAYSASDARAVKLAVMDAVGGYELTVNLKAVTSKTLDVTAPVEAGASFELSPDGKLHENVMANQTSTLKSNNFVPLSGYVSSVAPLTKNSTVTYPDNTTKQVSEELVPVATKLSASTSPITDAGKVRLFAGTATGTGDTAGLTPLAATLYYDPTKSTVPLAFSVPGSGEVVWKWGMDYTGTYFEPNGVFGYSMGYTFGLPSNDVTSAQLSEKA